MYRIAIEPSLTPIKEYLAQKGYQCDLLENTNENLTQGTYKAVVVTGGDINLMGMQNIEFACPVINAEGLTPEQVYDRLQSIPQ
ncbi:YkuS family protein [Hazenella coriacea]|uniref:Uncharacterized protein UPF0180 n=1 Tax=Hazenella coriacea TaxID=1179467 RepID=A0A4R3LA23_9BACL|nr:YkuS family protein [Hazenella coriacea]TCS96569.1 uncharacterized protein UPF0180 [Hazenella coriacea]